MADQTTATVETLTAEVRVLMVGNRQVTASVAKQLDHVALSELEIMGRVRIETCSTCGSGARFDRFGFERGPAIHLIGVGPAGDLCLAAVRLKPGAEHSIPLIVLAGLR